MECIVKTPVAYAYRKFVNNKESDDGCIWAFETVETKGAAVRIPLYTVEDHENIFIKHKTKATFNV